MFWDSSALVPLLFAEPHSAALTALVGRAVGAGDEEEVGFSERSGRGLLLLSLESRLGGGGEAVAAILAALFRRGGGHDDF